MNVNIVWGEPEQAIIHDVNVMHESEFDTVSVHLSGGVLICLYGFKWFDDQPFDEWEIVFSWSF